MNTQDTQDLKCVEELEKLHADADIDKEERDTIDRLKERVPNKGSCLRSPPRQGEIRTQVHCQPDQHWHCFKANNGETSDKQFRAHNYRFFRRRGLRDGAEKAS